MKRPSPSTWLIILLLGLPQISEAIFTPSLPSLAQSLRADAEVMQRTFCVYFMGFSAGVCYWGWLSDRVGRRLTLLLGLHIYVIGTLGCLFTTSINGLLLTRAIQAFGISASPIIVLTIIREVFLSRDRIIIFSAINMALAFTPAICPFIGGYLSQHFGWKANFLCILLIGIGIISYVFSSLPETKQLTQQERAPKKPRLVLSALLKDRRLLGSIWLMGAVNGLLVIYYSEAPFIFINLLGLTPSHYGSLGIFVALAMMAGALASNKLSHRLTNHQMIAVALVIIFLGSLLLSIFSLAGCINAAYIGRSVFLIMLPIAVVLGCYCIIVPAVQSSALDKYQSDLGLAGGFFTFAYNMVVAVLTGLMGLLPTENFIVLPLFFLIISVSIVCVYKLTHQLQPL